MSLKDIAKVFCMSIEQFAAFIGYSRQALYGTPKYSAKSREAIVKVRKLNNALYDADIKMAEVRYQARNTAICELQKLFMDGGVSKNG